jgi:hypothetical protein
MEAVHTFDPDDMAAFAEFMKARKKVPQDANHVRE